MDMGISIYTDTDADTDPDPDPYNERNLPWGFRAAAEFRDRTSLIERI
jgi:hypothetical protein